MMFCFTNYCEFSWGEGITYLIMVFCFSEEDNESVVNLLPATVACSLSSLNSEAAIVLAFFCVGLQICTCDLLLEAAVEERVRKLPSRHGVRDTARLRGKCLPSALSVGAGAPGTSWPLHAFRALDGACRLPLCQLC